MALNNTVEGMINSEFMNIAFEATSKTVMLMRPAFMQTPVVVQLVMTLWLEGSKQTMLITSKVIVAQTTFFLPMISTSVSLKQSPPQSRIGGQ